MGITFGQVSNGQRAHEGGGFYSTPGTLVETGEVYRPNASTPLFGIPDYPVAAGTRRWFNNGSIGDIRYFNRPATWTSVEGQEVYWNTTTKVITTSATGAISIGYEVDTKGGNAGGMITVAIRIKA